VPLYKSDAAPAGCAAVSADFQNGYYAVKMDNPANIRFENSQLSIRLCAEDG